MAHHSAHLLFKAELAWDCEMASLGVQTVSMKSNTAQGLSESWLLKARKGRVARVSCLISHPRAASIFSYSYVSYCDLHSVTFQEPI